MEVNFTYNAKVVEVVDGDTLDAVIDLGFGVMLKHRLRLKDVHAAESGTPKGVEHARLLGVLFPRGTPVTIQTKRSDMYGRYEAQVWVGGVDANEAQRLAIGFPSGRGAKLDPGLMYLGVEISKLNPTEWSNLVKLAKARFPKSATANAVSRYLKTL